MSFSSPDAFATVFRSTDGIGGYTLDTHFDRVFAFDGQSTGKLDHLVLFRPGGGPFSVLRNTAGTFNPIYEAKSGGIGAFDFSGWYDRAIAFDFGHTGKMDHILCYRPGEGGCFVFHHDGNGTFTAVHSMPPSAKPTAHAGQGIGGYELRFNWDRVIAFDYDHSGKQDYLVCYRRFRSAPGAKAETAGTPRFWILKHEAHFTPVYKNNDGGIGGYEMGAEGDYVLAYDYDKSGCMDHFLIVRFNSHDGPADPHRKSAVTVVKHQGNHFTMVFHTNATIGSGASELSVTNLWLRGLPFDFDSSGRRDHLAISGGGAGLFWVLTGPSFGRVRYKQGEAVGVNEVKKGQGVGSCDMGSRSDRVVAFDYEGSGCCDHLLVYRYGTKRVWILKRAAGGA